MLVGVALLAGIAQSAPGVLSAPGGSGLDEPRDDYRTELLDEVKRHPLLLDELIVVLYLNEESISRNVALSANESGSPPPLLPVLSLFAMSASSLSSARTRGPNIASNRR